MDARKAAAIVAALASTAALIGIVVATAAQSWTVTITGPSGGKWTYEVSADSEDEAEDIAWGVNHRARYTIVATTDDPPPTGVGYPSLAASEIDYDGDFDSGCPSSGVGGEGGWDRSVVGTDYPGSFSIDRTRVVEGTCSGKFTGTASGGGQSRAELAKNEGQPNAEVVYEFASFIPSNMGNVKEITQHKQSGNIAGSCYNGGLHVENSVTPPRLELIAVGGCNSGDETETHYSLGSLIRDRWVAYKVYVHFANSGAVRAWVDPDAVGPAPYEERLPLTQADTVSDPSYGIKFRIGQYGRPNQGASLWADGFHMNCLSLSC